MSTKNTKPKYASEEEFLKDQNRQFPGSLTADPNDPVNFYDQNGTAVPKANYSHLWKQEENKPTETVTDTQGNVVGVDPSVNAEDLGGVASIETHNDDGTVDSKPVKNPGSAANNTPKDKPPKYTPPDPNKVYKFTDSKGGIDYGISNEQARNILKNLQNNQNYVKDYFSDSMSGMWKNLDPKDKKILILDQIGTTLKNLSKARLPMYSAYGKNYEGRGFGEEKSALQKSLESSLQAGLGRRNDRLNQAMNEQMKVANFPAELEMKMRDYWKKLQFNNQAKIDMINRMSNVEYMKALSAFYKMNPHAAVEDAFRVVDQVINGIAAAMPMSSPAQGTAYSNTSGF